MMSVRWPSSDRRIPVAAATLVLPTPPFPLNSRMRIKAYFFSSDSNTVAPILRSHRDHAAQPDVPRWDVSVRQPDASLLPRQEQSRPVFPRRVSPHPAARHLAVGRI